MIEITITSSALISVIILLRFLFRGKISCRLQYALWGLVLLRLLMPFSLFESPLSIMNLTKADENEIITQMPPATAERITFSAINLPQDIKTTTDDTVPQTINPINKEETDLSEKLSSLSASMIFTVTQIIGSVLIGLWFMGSNFVFYKRLRKTREVYTTAACKLPVYVTDGIASPCLFGIFHPSVYLTPKALENADNTRYVLAHETYHYRHGDHIWSLLRSLCLTAYWWNPFVWAAAVLSREDSEFACDEAVIKKIGNENRLAYGHTLLDMIAVRKTPSGLMNTSTVMLSDKRGLKGRLNMIIKNPKSFLSAIMAVILITALCIILTFTGADTKEPDLFMNTASEDLQAKALQPDYTLIQYDGDNAGAYTIPLTSDDDIRLVKDILMDYLVKSNARPGKDVSELGGYYLLRTTYPDGTSTDYYAYLMEDKAVMQRGSTNENSLYSYINKGLYNKLTELADNHTAEDNGPDELAPVTDNIDRTNLEYCITDAILTSNAGSNDNSDFRAEAHTVLKTEETGDTVTVYAMALFMKFGYAGGGFFETGGSHMPVAITFCRNEDGAYELTEYWIPLDGSYYASSIREKFPSDIYEEAIDTQKFILAHTRFCYDQAIAYGQVNTDNEISKLIEVITSSPNQMSNPQTYIEKHALEYRELLYYGKHTLHYCFWQFEQGGQNGLKGHIMASACEEIVGEAEYYHHPSLNTGQDWYDAFKQRAKTLRKENGDIYMQDNMPGSWLLLQMLDASDD